MNAAMARILIRYLTAFLVGYGFLEPSIGEMITSDKDIAFIVQTLLGLAGVTAAELWYVIDRMKGKTT